MIESANIRRPKLRLATVLLAILLFTALASTVSSLRVSGVILQAEPAPGDRVDLSMEVGLGQNDTPTNFSLEVMDWQQSLQGDNNAVENYSTPYSAKNLLKVAPSSFYLESGDAQKVTVEVDIPKEAKAGGRYAIINVHSAQEGVTGDSVVSTHVAINALVALNVTGPGIQKSGEITNLSAEEPSSANRQNVSLIFNNTGNIHYKILTEMVLKDNEGRVLANATILPISSVLPGASRLLQLSLIPAERLLPGTYIVEAKVSLENERMLASRSAQLKVSLSF